MTSRARLGLIVNPIAGMGGRVGLKGTDGGDTLRLAVERGAVPRAGERAAQALRALLERREPPDDAVLYAGAGEMGERAARDAGFAAVIVGKKRTCGPTGPEDTREAALRMMEEGVSLILFAGGDGTARDIHAAAGERQTVLGIPAGVKIHSAAFARSPAQAGILAALYLSGRSAVRERLAEVMDIDEEAYRGGVLRATLYGYLRIPHERGRVQGLKAGSPASEGAQAAAIAASVAAAIQAEPETLWLIGAGSTTRCLKEALGDSGALLGIDAYMGGAFAGWDMNERGILNMIAKHGARQVKIVLTPIGGQGFLLGRGNQQLSPEVIRLAGKQNLVVLATPNKLHALAGGPLLSDTGDPALDAELEGYYRVITGCEQFSMYALRAV